VALFNVAAEKAAQVVTNYDSHVFLPGSFRSAAGATSAPNAHAFAGTVTIGEALANPPTNQNVVVEARDLGDTVSPGRKYVREKKAGTWGSWGEGVYAAPLDALAYNGMQVNGALDLSQEKGSTLLTNITTATYLADNWWTLKSSSAVCNSQLVTDAPAGFGTSLKITVTTGAAMGASDYVVLVHPIEGYRTACCAFGAASAQPVTLGFWVKAHRTGAYSGSLQNAAQNRSYPFSYTVSVADTWEYKTVTVTGDTTGTWAKTNAVGFFVLFAIAAGVSVAGTAATWSASGLFGATGTTNGVAATSDIFQITGLVVLPGTQAPSATQSPLIMRPYDQELQTCQRYWQKLGGGISLDILFSGYNAAGTNIGYTLPFPVAMRATPSAVIVGTWASGNAGTPGVAGASPVSMSLQFSATATGNAYIYTTGATTYISLDARL
jgi:hypothetical protein